MVVRAGLPTGFHFHDLRQTGNHLAALSGSSTRELMHRMGHSTMWAALVYQHATDDRAREIADRLSALVTAEVGTQNRAAISSERAGSHQCQLHVGCA